MCPSRLRRSTQVVTESTAVLFDTETAGDGVATDAYLGRASLFAEPLGLSPVQKQGWAKIGK